MTVVAHTIAADAATAVTATIAVVDATTAGDATTVDPASVEGAAAAAVATIACPSPAGVPRCVGGPSSSAAGASCLRSNQMGHASARVWHSLPVLLSGSPHIQMRACSVGLECGRTMLCGILRTCEATTKYKCGRTAD